MFYKTGLEKRKYPLRMSIASMREDVSIQLGAGYGQFHATTHRFRTSRSTTSVASHSRAKLECSTEFKLQTVQFSPGQWAIETQPQGAG
jgi:hypothetical protein